MQDELGLSLEVDVGELSSQTEDHRPHPLPEHRQRPSHRLRARKVERKHGHAGNPHPHEQSKSSIRAKCITLQHVRRPEEDPRPQYRSALDKRGAEPARLHGRISTDAFLFPVCLERGYHFPPQLQLSHVASRDGLSNPGQSSSQTVTSRLGHDAGDRIHHVGEAAIPGHVRLRAAQIECRFADGAAAAHVPRSRQHREPQLLDLTHEP